MNPETIIERLHPVARELLVEIAALYFVTPELVVGHCRLKPIKLARHHWWAALYGRLPGWSYPYIGNLTGHDHTTIMSGHRKHLVRAMSAMPIGQPAKVAAPEFQPPTVEVA